MERQRERLIRAALLESSAVLPRRDHPNPTVNPVLLIGWLFFFFLYRCTHKENTYTLFFFFLFFVFMILTVCLNINTNKQNNNTHPSLRIAAAERLWSGSESVVAPRAALLESSAVLPRRDHPNPTVNASVLLIGWLFFLFFLYRCTHKEQQNIH